MSRKVTLKSSNGDCFEIEEKVALQSQILSRIIEDNSGDSLSEIPLQNITTEILTKVIDYCKKHVNGGSEVDEEEMKKWDAEFVNVDMSTLFEFIMAANFLEIKTLLDLSCQRAADLIKDKSVDEVRSIFGIENDFTPEEEEAIRKENQWAFD